jgi:hypothetical protein
MRAIMIRPVPPPETPDGRGGGAKFAWFLGIAVLSALLTAAVAYAMRALPFAG